MFRRFVVPSSSRVKQFRKTKCVGNWVLKAVFGPTREEVTGCWRECIIEELHNV
jgi:hypothetical protein